MIRIYSDLTTNSIFFEGSTVSPKPVGEVEAVAHPTQAERVIIRSTTKFKKGSDTEYRVYFRRMKITRIADSSGQALTEAPLNMGRDAVIEYLNQQFTKPKVVEYFEYNPTTDRLKATKAIETTLSSLFLGGQHRISSGAANIYFDDLTTGISHYPVTGGLEDQSLAASQLAGAGFNPPKARIFGDFGSVPLGGSPVNDTAIAYDGDNFFSFNISGVGITTRVAEVVPADQQLKYELSVDGTPVYIQYLEHSGLAVNEDLTWYFTHPLDIEAGSTNHASIRKVSTVNNQETDEGLLLVCEGDAVATRYQTNVLHRLFDDKDVAFKEDIDSILSGSIYKGGYNAATDSPSLPTGSDSLGDFYRVTAAGGAYAVGDILVYNGTDYDHIPEGSITQSDILTSSLKVHDVYVKAGYVGTVSDGSILYPYADVATAVASASDGDSIYLDGVFSTPSEIVLPSDKSLYFYGSDGACVQYATYDATNGDVFSYVGDGTKELKFVNIEFKNAGGYGLLLKKTAKTTVEDCVFKNNGWDGTQLNTVLPESITTLLGYDSTSADLQAFYAGSSASNGGAMRIEEATQVLVVGNTVTQNLRGIRVQDCGVGGAGVISRNQSTQNIESGIYIAAGGTYGGCQNVTVMMNVSAYNANNGLLLIGGINNKFSQNEVNGNWNAGWCAWGSANATLRDCGLYDNNRSQFNGIGNPGDAKASIQINEAYNLLGTTISLNPAARFIAEVLDTQVHYTGLGSNTDKIGLLVTSGVGALPANEHNLINIDDVGFIGQDYAMDFSEVDVTNLQVSLGDCRYQNIAEYAVKPPLAGNYSELPFSNHVTSVKQLDVVVDTLKQSIALTEGVGGNVINTYSANELQSVISGSAIDIIQKDSDKIQLRGLTLGNVFVNGVAAGNSVNSMNDTVNAAFTMDLAEYKEFLTSDVGLNSGETLPAQTNNWFIAYGARAEEQIVSAGVVADVKDVQPFYNGDFLDKGHEYTWTHYGASSYMVGVWSGAEAATAESDAFNTINWTPAFRFVSSSNRFSPSASAGVDMATRLTAGDSANVVADGHYNVIDGQTQLALRYGNDNYLYLVDITEGADFIIGRSNSTLIGDNVTIFFAGENQPNAQFPVMQERTDRWTIVHDLNSSEAGEWFDGIEESTVLRSNMEISPGQKVTMNLDYFGRFERIGFNYTGAASAVNNAQDAIESALFYNSAEAIKAVDDADWTWNLAATYSFDPNGDQSDIGYWLGSGSVLGLISLRYLPDNTVEMWHETNNELMATLTAPLDGNPFKVHLGANEDMPQERLPQLQRYALAVEDDPSGPTTWYFIDSPDGTFSYPLFATEEEANSVDLAEGGSGSSHAHAYPDDPTSTTWYMPDTGGEMAGNAAPSHGVYGTFTNVIWNEIATEADSGSAPPAFTAIAQGLDEGGTLNLNIHPAGAAFTTTISGGPSWVTQATANANVTGTAPEVAGDSTNFPQDSYTVSVVRTNGYGSSVGTLTIEVNNTTPLVSLPGTLHTGSVIASTATNSAGKIHLQTTGGELVYDIDVLEDGDQIQWYHQDGTYGFGIAAAGVDKTSDMLDQDVDNSAKWDLLAPITGAPTNTNGQNFGDGFPGSQPGLAPIGWDDNTSPQAIPTRPVYAATDIWKLYNNAGTIELSLNGTLFRSSSSTHTDPMITFAMSVQAGSGGVAETSEMPTFTHYANSASAPSGFILDHGTMDTTELLSGDSVALLGNLSLKPGQRFIAPKTWWNTNVLPYIDGASGEDNKVFIGVPKSAANWATIVEQDFYAMHRAENQTANLTKLTQYYAGPIPQDQHLNVSSDTDVLYNMAIEFTREGDLVTMRSVDASPSLLTEPVGGTFGQTQTWTGASATTGTSPLGLVVAAKESETRVKLVETGLSVITAPSKANEFDVTEDTSSLPLFNGDPAGDITLAAGSTYKFWLHSDSIESTDSLGICLISDNSDYTTGVTVTGTPGSFGAYVEFAVPTDVPPVKFKWTSGGVAYYVAPVISGSTYSVGVTGITQEGPAANQTGTNVMDQYDHGWISLDETLSAGERLVLDNAFFTDFFGEVKGTNNVFAIGLKGDNWSNTKEVSSNGAAATGLTFKGNTYIVGIWNSGASSVTMWVCANGLLGNSMYLNTSSLWQTACAFLEITGSGNNIRAGLGRNGNAGVSQGDESTTTYGNWLSYKGQTGEQGYGITSLDVVMSFWTFNGGDIDGAEIDWTGLSEIAIPTAATNATDWDKALDFSGSNEHLKQVSSNNDYNPLRMNGTAVTVGLPDQAGSTVRSTNARPWATSIVFKSDGNNSNQHIWNSGEGTATGNDNIFLRVSASGTLIFAWGREGSGYNECTIATNISSSTWYGVYIASTGARFNASDATASNLANAFDIRLMSSADSFAAVGSNLSTSSSWTSTGARMDRGVTGDFTIGGRGTNRNFHGKVAAMVVTNLRITVYPNTQIAMPSDAEVKMMITDPKGWEDDYRDGELVRAYNGVNTGTYSANDYVYGYLSNMIYLMGDGAADNFSQGVRNEVRFTDQNNVKLQLNSMQSNDFETVNIPGLT